MGVVVAEAGNEGWCACMSIALVYFGMVCAYLCWCTCSYIYWTCIVCIVHRHENQGRGQGFLTPSLLASSGQIYMCIACLAVHMLYVELSSSLTCVNVPTPLLCLSIACRILEISHLFCAGPGQGHLKDMTDTDRTSLPSLPAV